MGRAPSPGLMPFPPTSHHPAPHRQHQRWVIGSVMRARGKGAPLSPHPQDAPIYLQMRSWFLDYAESVGDYSPLDSCLWLPAGRKFYYYCVYKNQQVAGRAGKLDTFYKMWKTEFPWIRISGGCLFTRCGLCEFLKDAASAAKSMAVRDTIIYSFSPIWPISSHSFNFISRPSIMSACASDVNVAPFRWFMLSISPGPCAGPPRVRPPGSVACGSVCRPLYHDPLVSAQFFRGF